MEVRDGNAFEASRHAHDGRRHDEERGDPDKRPTPQSVISGRGPAPVPIPAARVPDIKMPGTKRFDLAPSFGRHAKPASSIKTPPKPVSRRATAASPVSSFAPGDTAGPPAISDASVQKPPAPRGPVLPLALVAAGAGVLAAAGHALKKLRGPRIRAEGAMGASRVGKPEFDPSAPPAIGFIVSPGKHAVSLAFDKTASGGAA